MFAQKKKIAALKHDLKTLTNGELCTFQAALENAISWLREFGQSHTIGDYSPLQQDIRSLVRLKNLLIKEVHISERSSIED